jgi:beta-lactamase class A
MKTFSIVFVLFGAIPLRAETSVQHLLENKMFAQLREYDAGMRGALGVATIDLTSGRVFVYNGEAVFPTASSIKIPILAEMFRQASAGKFNMSDPVALTEKDAVGGSGNLQADLKNGPKTLTVMDLITLMIRDSDNTATNRVIAIAGMDRVNALMDRLGFRTIRLRRIMMDAAAAQRGDENTASPLEMARLLEMLNAGKLSGPAETKQMINVLELVQAGFRKAVPETVEIASKPGGLPGVDCEAGIVYLPDRPFIAAIYTTFTDEEKAPVVDVMRIVYDYFSSIARSNEYGNRLR